MSSQSGQVEPRTHHPQSVSRSGEDASRRPGDAGSANRFPQYWTKSFGDVTISFLPDSQIELVPTGFISGSTEADWAAQKQRLTTDGYLAAGAGVLLVEKGESRLVVDVGFGPRSLSRSETPDYLGSMITGDLPRSLAAADIDPKDIECVAFTHLHGDHVGWAMASEAAGPRSLFANAAWFVGVGELSSGHRNDFLALAQEDERTHEVADGEEVIPGVTAWALPGHTAGHTAWVVDTGNEQVILFGDVFHSPAQVEHPEWVVFPDLDCERGIESRRQLLNRLSESDVIGVGVHFSDQQLGRVVDGTWKPLIH